MDNLLDQDNERDFVKYLFFTILSVITFRKNEVIEGKKRLLEERLDKI